MLIFEEEDWVTAEIGECRAGDIVRMREKDLFYLLDVSETDTDDIVRVSHEAHVNGVPAGNGHLMTYDVPFGLACEIYVPVPVPDEVREAARLQLKDLTDG